MAKSFDIYEKLATDYIVGKLELPQLPQIVVTSDDRLRAAIIEAIEWLDRGNAMQAKKVLRAVL